MIKTPTQNRSRDPNFLGGPYNGGRPLLVVGTCDRNRVCGISNKDHAAGVEHKKEIYRETGVACVFVDADMSNGYWPATIMQQMRDILAERLSRFDSLDVDM